MGTPQRNQRKSTALAASMSPRPVTGSGKPPVHTPRELGSRGAGRAITVEKVNIAAHAVLTMRSTVSIRDYTSKDWAALQIIVILPLTSVSC
jgi:hypothetical protein